jgi:dGTPase
MNWTTLLSGQRSGVAHTLADRTGFERDFDRVVFSSAFRRLQDKTQVIPLPESDFVHTRLTHSLEVSCVARSLGKMAGRVIIDRYNLKNFHESDFGAICATAALAHDIGNPPFGHSGEAAISNYFSNGSGKEWNSLVQPHEWTDLTNFEGNAYGFKILTNYNEASGGNINLTFATLGAFTKYPTRSFRDANINENDRKRVSRKKYGYFCSEQHLFNEVFDALQIENIDTWSRLRHPLVYLVEAADDICYRIIDFEDGIRIGWIPFAEGEQLLIAVIGEDFSNERYHQITDRNEKIGYLRAKAINTLINTCSDLFLEHEQEMLTGKFDRSLIDLLPEAMQVPLNQLLELSINHVYRSKSVLQIEAAGFEIVGELLDRFVRAGMDLKIRGKDLKKAKPYSDKLIRLMPPQFIKPADATDYSRILGVCEFVAGMTDSYALSLYRKLKGIDLPT